MPTLDRRPRRRVRPTTRSLSLAELTEQARSATPADWDSGLRRALVHSLVKAGHRQPAAEGIAPAYEKRPMYIPQPPPPNAPPADDV